MERKIKEDEARRLFDTYSNYVYRGALFLTKCPSLADDIVQEVFIKVYRNYDSFDQTKDIKPWIYKIMVNTVKNTLRKKTVYSLIGMWTDKEESVEVIESVEARYIDNQNSQMLWECVDRLSLKLKLVIYMHYYLELSLEEVSQCLDIPLGTCKSRLNAGLKKLREYMNQEQYVEKQMKEVVGKC